MAINAGTTATFTVSAGGGGLALVDGAAYSGSGTIVLANNSGVAGALKIGNISLGTAGTSFTGNVSVTAGTVTFATNAGGVGTGGDLFENTTILSVAPTATFDFAGNAETMGGIAGGGTIQSTGTAIGLTLVSPVDQTFSGTLSNTITNLAKNNNSNYVISGVNNYTGTTTVNGGSLRLVDNGTLAGTTGATTLGAAARLILDNTGTANIDNRVNSVATVTSNGGEIALRGARGRVVEPDVWRFDPGH